MAKKHHWLVLLVKPDKTLAYEGRHNAEVPARNAARDLCTAAGEDPDTYDEQVHEIIGPAPRTFVGNPFP